MHLWLHKNVTALDSSDQHVLEFFDSAHLFEHLQRSYFPFVFSYQFLILVHYRTKERTHFEMHTQMLLCVC